MSDSPTVTVTRNDEQHRYEGRVDGELAGFATYELTGADGATVVVMPHTEVDDAYEGQGVGSAIVRFALDDIRSQAGATVLPRCPFVKAWIDRHPDYASMVFTPTGH